MKVWLLALWLIQGEPKEAWERAAAAFDSKFETADRPDRLKLLAELSKYDRPEIADRFAAAAARLEKELDATLPWANPDPVPLDNKQNLRWDLVWRKFYTAEADKKKKTSDMEDVRAAVVAALHAFTKEATLQWMLDALASHPQAPSRAALAEALGKSAEERFAIALIDRLKKDESWQVRAAAAEALANRKSKESIDALKSALAAKEWQLRLTVLLSIPRFADVALTPALLRGLKDERWELRAASIRGIIASRDRSTVPALIDSLQDKTPEIRALALEAIGRLAGHTVLSALVPLFKDSDKTVRLAALAAVELSCGKRACRALAAAAADLPLRTDALAALVRIGSLSAVGPLVEALKDADFNLKTDIAKTLEKLTGVQKKNDKEWKTYWDQEYRKALGEFDAEFARSEAALRVKLVQSLASFDRKEVAERLLKALQIVDQQLRTFVPQKDQLLKEQQGIPDVEDAKGNVISPVVKHWKEYFDKQAELQKKISGLGDARAAALEALSALGDKDSIDWMLKRLAKSTEPWEREGLITAMAGGDPAQVASAVIEKLQKEKETSIRVAAIDTLAALRAPEAAAPLTALLSDPSWMVQLAALLALEQVSGKRAVPSLIDALATAEGRIASELRDALTRLTGLDRGTVEGWKEWWKNYGPSFLSGEARGSPPETEFKEPPKLPTFYGFTVSSKRVIFVLDRSGSMMEESEFVPAVKPGEDKPEGKRKIDIARFELRAVIRMLSEDTYFNVILFSEGAKAWQPTLVPATRGNREAAVAWAEALPAEGSTNTWDSLELAFQIPGPASDKRRDQGADTIFFASDGLPSVGRITGPSEILAELSRLNRTRRVRINTVTIGKEGSGIDPEFLKAMAEQNFGSSVWRK